MILNRHLPYRNILSLNPIDSQTIEDVKYYTLTTLMDVWPTENNPITYPTYGADEINHLESWKYHDFGYTINHLGFRFNEVLSDIDMAAFGCSFTFGQGLPDDFLWHHLLAEKLGMKHLNFGIPGASILTCIDIFCIVSKFINFKKAFFLLPSYNRIQIAKISETDKKKLGMFNCIPGNRGKLAESFGLYSETIFRDIPNDEIIKQTKNSLYLLDFISEVRNIKTYVSTWDQDTYELLELMNFKHIKLLPVWFTPDYLVWDKARDKRHPGPGHHEYFSKSVYESLSLSQHK